LTASPWKVFINFPPVLQFSCAVLDLSARIFEEICLFLGKFLLRKTVAFGPNVVDTLEKISPRIIWTPVKALGVFDLGFLFSEGTPIDVRPHFHVLFEIPHRGHLLVSEFTREPAGSQIR